MYRDPSRLQELNKTSTIEPMEASPANPLTVVIPTQKFHVLRVVSKNGWNCFDLSCGPFPLTFELKTVGDVVNTVYEANRGHRVFADTSPHELKFYGSIRAFHSGEKPLKHAESRLVLEHRHSHEFVIVVPSNQRHQQLVWYELLDSTGYHYLSTPLASMPCTKASTVTSFLAALCREHSAIMAGVDYEKDLVAYPNRALHALKEPLEGSASPHPYGQNSLDPLIVVVHSRKMWYTLYGEDKQPYFGSSPSFLPVSNEVKTVEGLLHGIISANFAYLANVDVIPQLQLYKTEIELCTYREPMHCSSSTLLGGLTEYDAFAVVVPTRFFWYSVLDIDGNNCCGIEPTSIPLKKRHEG
ncbi:hypothetical protein Poli38472_006472 [Pythium oligandrum]|uniref:Uncharacterized protein n=1 Tax=Pythium oligandrum TaxID=41045 RepID=A0A8K1FEB9_PYTOL|nr:hypothetical protein Poli38472_006472 [Pythium oligandrum]|eukprot:TMW56462.1 hypothetical protein Poli38472_006472 [Pythium oligandrum]